MLKLLQNLDHLRICMGHFILFLSYFPLYCHIYNTVCAIQFIISILACIIGKAMKKDGIAVTKHTSGLLCKAVIHLDMTGVNPSGFGGSIASAFSVKLKDRIKLALDKAEQIQIASVAFPALGNNK